MLAVGLSLATTSAFATKARLISLGDDQDGSFFIEDNRNMFLNPAHIVHNKDMVTLEWGNSGNQTSGGSTDTTPNSEAGVTYEAGNFVYGVQLGAENRAYNELRFDQGNVNRSAAVDNALDFFIGGSADLDWGVNLSYSNNENDAAAAATTVKEEKLMALKLGVIKGNWEAFVHAALTNEAEDGAGAKFESDSDYTLGGAYQSKNYKFYGKVRMYEYDEGAAAPLTSTEATEVTLGAGKVKKLNDKASLFARAELMWMTEETGTTVDNETIAIPLSLGVEAQAKNWLLLRGSVSTALYNRTEAKNGNKSDAANQVNVNAGASFLFDDLTVDGLIGTGNNGTGTITSSTTEQGVLSTDNLVTRVALTYKF